MRKARIGGIARVTTFAQESCGGEVEMERYRINWFRLTCATAFLMEIGSYFGMGRVPDQLPIEVIASGIAFLLFSMAIEKLW